ncbi:ribosomal protein S17, partial [Alphaproteobacteria bacterium]|nr:ribosomal protein S17 [Alphaproteobacteria bacterium]
AHDEANRSQEGEQVKIRECQPVSKRKFFEVVYDEVAKA